jgi:hypothetical protein
MLGAAAVVVVTAGGAGMLGPLGDLISGGERTFTESAATGASGSPAAAIVAAPSLGPALAVAPGGAPVHRRAGGRRGPGGRRPGGRPSPGLPGPAAPGNPPGAGGGGGGGGNPPPPPEPSNGRVVGAVGSAVQDLGRQAPPPARPLADQLGRLTDTVAGTCRSLPICP